MPVMTGLEATARIRGLEQQRAGNAAGTTAVSTTECATSHAVLTYPCVVQAFALGVAIVGLTADARTQVCRPASVARKGSFLM
jgi:CheY-like chemotaxis protein